VTLNVGTSSAATAIVLEGGLVEGGEEGAFRVPLAFFGSSSLAPMTKNSRGRATKKTVAKSAVKANQLKLQKRAQTQNATAMLDKELGLVYSVSVFLQSEKSGLKLFFTKVKQAKQAQHVSKNPAQVGGNVEELLRRL